MSISSSKVLFLLLYNYVYYYLLEEFVSVQCTVMTFVFRNYKEIQS